MGCYRRNDYDESGISIKFILFSKNILLFEINYPISG
jgi:hypothetical protein